jgi:phosphinothricin acetyltransferase
MKIREMLPKDWDQVKQIYESGMAIAIATFETTAPSWEKWDKGHLTFGRLVAIDHNEVVGWAALSPVSSRCVYGGVAEVSVYVGDKHKGKGIGKLLLEHT